MSNPILHRQLDRCDVCGKKIHRHKLVRTQVRWLQGESENKFSYSSYNAALWTADDAVAGYTSHGTRSDKTRCSVSSGNVVSIVDGVATWDTSTTLTSSAIDVSALTNLCMSVYVGPKQNSTSPELTITSGYGDGSNPNVTMVTRTTKSSERVWWTIPVVSLAYTSSAITFWVSVTATDDYWIDDFQLEDSTTPGEFLITNGSAQEYSVDTALMTVRKVCPTCRENLLVTSDVYVRTGDGIVEPQVPVDYQKP